MTPESFSKSDSMHQKHPPAKIAVSVLPEDATGVAVVFSSGADSVLCADVQAAKARIDIRAIFFMRGVYFNFVSIANDDVVTKTRLFACGFIGCKSALSSKFMIDNRLRVIFAQLYACLLYTSPSPRDATLSRMPSSA